MPSPAPCTVICSYRRNTPATDTPCPNLGLSLSHIFLGASHCLRCLATLRRSRRTSNFVMNYDERAEQHEYLTPLACRTLFIWKNVKLKARFRVGNALIACKI